MTSMSLRSLLFSALLALSSAIALMGGTALYNQHTLVAELRDTTNNWLPGIRDLSDVRYNAAMYRMLTGRSLLVKEPADRAKVEAKAEPLLAKIQKAAESYETTVTEPEEKRLWEAVRTAWADYLAADRRMRELSSKGETEAAAALLNSEMVTLFDRYSASIQAGVDFNNRGSIQAASSGESAATLGILIASVLLALGFLAGSGAAFVVVSRVVRPMKSITTAMAELAAGKLATPVPHTENRDEIGAMASAVQVFKDNAIRVKAMEEDERRQTAERTRRAENMVQVVGEVGEVVRRAAEGDFSARLQVATDDPDMKKLVSGINEINRLVDEATGEFADVLGRVAQGDLTQGVPTAYRGRFGELKEALNSTVERLSEAVSTIQTTSVEVGTAATEINSGANDLSSRTEQQASSLEETAATAEELAASVKASAQSSRQAVEIAREAMGVAADGGKIVKEAVEAMARIEQASQKISDITGVIDEIAFQTNLLALNAAVEAARAGDAGKGFAVVASEVRTLAQRSSEAAKDITGLISASGQEVGHGVKLVRGAGEALEKIVAASRKVSETVSDISTATGEQANGIEELTQAVAHMDQMTQQNAALAEESAASASALAEQIQRLNTLATSFRTRGGTGRVRTPAPAARANAPASEPDRLRQLAAEAFAGKRTPAPAAPARKAAGGGKGGWDEF